MECKVIRQCPICGWDKGKIIRRIQMVRYKIPISTEYNIVKCLNCGFCYADVEENQQQYNLYYKNYNMYSASTKLKETIISQMCEVRYEVFEKYVAKDSKILDIGCGDGTFLRYLKDRGYSNIYGIDPSEKSIYCLKEKGIDGEVGNIFDEVSEKLRNKYDVVTCTAVLEHINDLKSAMAQIDLYLQPQDGKIFIEVPAVEGFKDNIFPVANYFNHEHINYFSINSLDNLLLKNGYKRISEKEEVYKIIIENETKNELSLCAMYKKSKIPAYILPDNVSELSIEEYFYRIDNRSNDTKKYVSNIICLENKIVIWGTGSFTLQILKEIPELQNHIVYFVDNNELKQGKELEGKMIYSPQQLLIDRNYFILICSMMNSNEIVEQIKKMNLKNKYYIVE